MRSSSLSIATISARLAPALVVAVLAGLAAVAGERAMIVVLILALALALVWIDRQRATLVAATLRIARLGAVAEPETLEHGVAEIEQQLHALQHRIAETHPVSGLPVRERLIERIAGESVGRLGVIAFSDFDRLSAFDPVLADRVFATCSARLRAMVPPRRFLAQIDRGHIGLWFDGDVAEADAAAELDAIRYALSEVIDDDGAQIIPQVGCRLAAYTATERSPGAFIARALASFAIPAGGFASGGATLVVDPAETARDRFALEQDLRQAVDRRELRLVFQPLVDAEQGCVGGAEALIRWDHPTRGLIPPTQFVPVLEALGLAQEIGTWALNTAVRETRVWAGMGLGSLRIAVNVSSLQLERDDLPQLVQRTLQSHGASASQLEIELTESVATSDAAHSRRIFGALRAMGIKLAVDDFGTGYSGFSSLRTLAFDKIKIDREFVTAVDARSDSQAICQSIIALGRGLGIRVLAEGVERWEEYAWLRRHGCHHFQGYYFGQPMTGEALAAFARDTAGLARLLATRLDVDAISERLQA